MSARTIANPYWGAVENHVDPTGSLWRTPSVDGLGRYRDADGFDVERWAAERLDRHSLVKRFSWTITDPSTLAFVVEQSGGRLIDPMAGTGYWGFVLMQLGVDVVSFDKAPRTNHYHEGQPLWSAVSAMEGVDAVRLHQDRTLLLSWPPMNPAGADILHAYTGARVIYIGESEGGCTGDDDLHEALSKHWAEVASHVPVQWDGLHDVVTVYERAGGVS